MKPSTWEMERRKQLQLLLEQGYTVGRVSEILGLARPTIFAEIKRGTTVDEYREKRFVKYSIERAICAEVAQYFGKEAIDVIKAYDGDEV